MPAGQQVVAPLRYACLLVAGGPVLSQQLRGGDSAGLPKTAKEQLVVFLQMLQQSCLQPKTPLNPPQLAKPPKQTRGAWMQKQTW